MPKASLEQMLAIVPPQCQRMLDQKVSDIHLDDIARALTNWKSVCTKLGISEAEEEAIKEENQGADDRRYIDFSLSLKLLNNLNSSSDVGVKIKIRLSQQQPLFSKRA